jgi:hypothetical protein
MRLEGVEGDRVGVPSKARGANCPGAAAFFSRGNEELSSTGAGAVEGDSGSKPANGSSGVRLVVPPLPAGKSRGRHRAGQDPPQCLAAAAAVAQVQMRHSEAPGQGGDGSELEDCTTALDSGMMASGWAGWEVVRVRFLALVQQRWVVGFLSSLILHSLFLILLALWTLQVAGRGHTGLPIVAQVNTTLADNLDEVVLQLSAADADPAPSSSVRNDSLLSEPKASVSRAQLSTLIEMALEDNGHASPAVNATAAMMEMTRNSTVATLGHAGVDGRSPADRKRLAMQRGGNLESEAAVERALEWLVNHQRPNGSWSLVHTKPACNGECTHEGSQDRYDPAATGLALLAFLGAGYTHRDGKHAEVVRKGIYYLLQILEETPQGGSFLYGSPQGMYNHGIATFALCEAYQLSGDDSLRGPAQLAVTFISSSQSYAGGWGYLPKQPGDLTITGWQTMALKSAQSAGLTVPAATILRLDSFLDSQTDAAKTFYGYRVPGKSPTCTAIGLILRMFRGWTTSDPRVLDGAQFQEGLGPSRHDMYRNYYVTLLLFHIGGPTFQRWNTPLRDYLVSSQAQHGHAAGSWYFEDQFGDKGGRLYNTAICAMILEVYYRYSPLYLNIERPFEL